MEGGAAKHKEAALAADLKLAGGGAPQVGGDAAPAVAQNQAPAGDTGAQVGGVPAAYKEDVVAPVGDSHKQSELGARGVPLGKKKPDDHQPLLQNDQPAHLKDEKSLDKEKETFENLQKV